MNARRNEARRAVFPRAVFPRAVFPRAVFPRAVFPRAAGIRRRAFLRGATGIAVGLPFLESVPRRSAWALGSEPRFALFIGTANGVVQNRFWPTATDATLTDLSGDTNAAGALAGFEQWITFVRGTRYPGSQSGCSHAQGGSQMYTGAPHDGGVSNNALATAPSIDTIIAPYLNPDGAEPLALYSGMKGGYIDERLSFIDAGVLRAAQNNPYEVYLDLMRAGTSMTTDDEAAATDEQLSELLARRGSAIDLVRDDLQSFLADPALSAADRNRLELHLNSLRELETGITDSPMGVGTCNESSLDIDAITASAETYRTNGVVEHIAELQMQLAAFAFACNINRVATLQIGDAQDSTVYDVPSNARGWSFHHISHRVQSDGAVGNDPLAEAAHAEIDRLRLETFRRGLVRFQEHNLLDRSIIMWTSNIADGPSGSFTNLPTIVAGNAGGSFRTGLHFSTSSSGGFTMNGQLLTTLAYALGVDENIGTSEGMIDELLT